MTPEPNAEQEDVIEAMVDFILNSDEHFFRLYGSAGTGKTFCIQRLISRVKGRLIFTAPTNKATKVIRDTLTSAEYKPECRTIYSLLGLRLEANGEVKELAVPEDPVDITQYKAVIVDEGSMVNTALIRFIREVAIAQGVKFIFLGDPAQLPPVKEIRSPIWDLDCPSSTLTKVMRHDNQILGLATRLRQIVDHPAPQIRLSSDNANGQGIWRLTEPDFSAKILEIADLGVFSNGTAKAIAWRNVTVDDLNKRIRRRIFDNATEVPWLVGDRVIITEPAKDLEGKPMASTDDEGIVTKVAEDWHPLYQEFKIWRVSVTTDDNRLVTFQVLHEDSVHLFAEKSERLAEAARMDRRKWIFFWNFKEAFHKLRHAYAITAHRAQGSTYERVFVDWRDILLNRNRQEAYRCLYVACTRPKRELYLN